MRVFAFTDIGNARAVNEDSYYAPAKGEKFCCVADGMGGHQAGEVASALAADIFAHKMRDGFVAMPERLRRAVDSANSAIYERASANKAMSGMGTTMTALAIEEGVAHIAQVGDSRAYLLRNKNLSRVTTDHTLVEELVNKGVITPAAARIHPKRNIITRALGTSAHVEIDMFEVAVQAGDRFLLCSDGLSGYVSDHEIAEILNSRIKEEDKVAALVQSALDAGGRDNITAMLVEIEEVSSW